MGLPVVEEMARIRGEVGEDGWAAPRMRVAHLATVIEERVIDAEEAGPAEARVLEFDAIPP